MRKPCCAIPYTFIPSTNHALPLQELGYRVRTVLYHPKNSDAVLCFPLSFLNLIRLFIYFAVLFKGIKVAGKSSDGGRALLDIYVYEGYPL